MKYDSIEISKNNLKYAITFHDTRGLGDPNMTVQEIIEQWNSYIMTDLNSINYVMIIMKPDRIRSSVSKEMKLIFDHIINLGAKKENLIFILTNCDFYEQIAINNFFKELSEYPDIKEIIESCNIKIAGCSGKPNLFKNEFREMIIAENFKMKSILQNSICNNVQSFKARKVIMDDIQEKQLKEMDEIKKSKEKLEKQLIDSQNQLAKKKCIIQ